MSVPSQQAALKPVEPATPTPEPGLKPEFSADEALLRLKEGNARFAAGTSQHPDQDPRRRLETTTEAQRPLATIVTCSDSRVPPEILFDQGLGRLFVIRVAGNVCGDDLVASLEFAVARLATPLLVVMGHSQCAAVAAALDNETLPGNLPALVDKIRPVAARVRQEVVCLDDSHLLNAAVEANVWQSIDDILETSPILRQRNGLGELTILGARYDTGSGLVHWLGQRRIECWGY